MTPVDLAFNIDLFTRKLLKIDGKRGKFQIYKLFLIGQILSGSESFHVVKLM